MRVCGPCGGPEVCPAQGDLQQAPIRASALTITPPQCGHGAPRTLTDKCFRRSLEVKGRAGRGRGVKGMGDLVLGIRGIPDGGPDSSDIPGLLSWLV